MQIASTRLAAINNHRFPGQYYDSETGLHYNLMRYYSPQTGRYITSDPTGLDGGLNTYGYAYQNPIMYYDPNGETPAHAARGAWWVGTRIGAGINYGIEAAFGASLGVLIYNACNSDDTDDREERCDKLYYEIDIPVCRAIAKKRGKAAAARCYATAAQRYAACLKGGTLPELDTRNN
jgi:RHS repeat-associated protein